jgi:hypothetical protein
MLYEKISSRYMVSTVDACDVVLARIDTGRATDTLLMTIHLGVYIHHILAHLRSTVCMLFMGPGFPTTHIMSSFRGGLSICG